ncbi:hypothetical protein JFR02_005103 [Vibrio harveyi]|nr:hypothetical protein [Vibrio harveyi]
MVKTQFQLFKVQSFASVQAVVLFFGADRAGQSRVCFWLQLRSVSLLGTKADLLAEMTFSLVLQVPRGSSDFVESPHCEIGFPKAPFGVVSSFSAALFVPSGFIE